MDSKYEIFTAERSKLDLTNQYEVNKFFSSIHPEVVLIAAAKVGEYMQIVFIPQTLFIKIL